MQTKENKTMNHTPTPWRHEKKPYNGYRIISDSGGDQVIEFSDFEGSEANAEFIVTAVNAHEDLVEALKYLIEETEKPANEKNIPHVRMICKEALAKAGVKA